MVNFLAGAVVAEANPQAGYTRHPTAFLPAGAAAPWPSFIGFMGTLHRLSGEKPANADEDVYQVRRIPSFDDGENPLADFVIWDCPDMTTWASAGYVNRLMEVAALADVVVYVASDERYNDEVPTQFLHLLIKAGKSVVVVLTKVQEANAPALADHFRREILGRLPRLPNGATPAVPVISFPQMPPAERADPTGAGAKHRVQLLNQILVQCDSDIGARARTVANAAKYLTHAPATACSKWPAATWPNTTPGRRPSRPARSSSRNATATSSFPASSSTASTDTARRLMDLLELPGAAACSAV